MKLLTKFGAIATVGASTMFGVGCVGMNANGGNSAPAFERYVDADAKNMEFEREYAKENGKVLVPIYIPDPANPGKKKQVYGVRSKTWMESGNETLGKYAPSIDTIYKTGDLILGTQNTINGYRQVSATKDVADNVSSAGSKVSGAINNNTQATKEQTNVLGTFIQAGLRDI